nr:hypothetical protein [Tanacetum cinerariifolium]
MNQSFSTLNKEKNGPFDYFNLCYSEADWKSQVGAAFVSKGDNEVPFEFKTKGMVYRTAYSDDAEELQPKLWIWVGYTEGCGCGV